MTDQIKTLRTKPIIILEGFNEGKNRLNEILKSNGYWVWNVSHLNSASICMKELGWDGDKDDKYYEFLKDLIEKANETFDYSYKYISGMIEKLYKHERANIMIVHNVEKDVVSRLKEDFGAFTMLITRSKNTATQNFDKVIIFDDNFEQSLLNTLEILSK